MSSFSSTAFYRVTGPQSIARLTPLLPLICEEIIWQPAILGTTNIIDFTWETTCEIIWKELHDNSRVLNRLSNSVVFIIKALFSCFDYLCSDS